MLTSLVVDYLIFHAFTIERNQLHVQPGTGRTEKLSYHLVFPPSSVKVYRAIPAPLEHRPATAPGLHITKYLWKERTK